MNENFKRYRLVDDDEMKREKQIVEYDPEVAAEARKRSRIADVLDDPTLNPELKLQLIRHFTQTQKTIQPAQSKVKTVSLQIAQPHLKTQLPTAITEPPPLEPEAQDVAPVLKLQEQEVKFTSAAEMLPASSKTKAQELAVLLSKNPEIIDVNEDGELVIEGKLIPHSNITHTFRYLYNPGASRDVPTGINPVLQSLAKLKVPLRLISNKNARALLNDMIQIGTGKRKSSKAPSFSRLYSNSNPKKPIGFAKKPFKSLNLWKI